MEPLSALSLWPDVYVLSSLSLRSDHPPPPDLVSIA